MGFDYSNEQWFCRRNDRVWCYDPWHLCSLDRSDCGAPSPPLPIVRRLVPGGPADIDGRLMLGDCILVDATPRSHMQSIKHVLRLEFSFIIAQLT
jgi:hypothetical protein